MKNLPINLEDRKNKLLKLREKRFYRNSFHIPLTRGGKRMLVRDFGFRAREMIRVRQRMDKIIARNMIRVRKRMDKILARNIN
jgi:hypothetical protein